MNARVQQKRNRGGFSAYFRREPLTSEEAQRLINACLTGRERLVIMTLLDTGLRVSEFAKLRRDMIDWQAHRLVVTGKRNRRRVIPLTPRTRAILEAHFALEDGIGIAPRTIEEIVRRVARRAGITKKVTPHVLRHSFAVFSLQRGISLPSLQKVLGHSQLTTTAIYLNISPEEAVREYLEKF